MDEEIQEEQPAEPPAPEPAPRPTREQLYGALAEELNLRPEEVAGALHLRDQFARSQSEIERERQALQEMKRQLEDEREKQRFTGMGDQFVDPNQRMLYEMMMEDRAERRREREERKRQDDENRRAQQMSQELLDAHENLMRGVPTHEQVPFEKFVANGMRRLYPVLPEGMTPAQAVANTAQFLGISHQNGYSTPQPQPNPRDRRASVMIPAGPTAQGGQSSPSGLDAMGQRDGETIEQYRDRLERLIREQNMTLMNLPEGRRFSSG